MFGRSGQRMPASSILFVTVRNPSGGLALHNFSRSYTSQLEKFEFLAWTQFKKLSCGFSQFGIATVALLGQTYLLSTPASILQLQYLQSVFALAPWDMNVWEKPGTWVWLEGWCSLVPRVLADKQQAWNQAQSKIIHREPALHSISNHIQSDYNHIIFL